VPGVGGVFEITVDGRLAFSKKQTGRFPTDEEIDAVGAGWVEPAPTRGGGWRVLRAARHFLSAAGRAGSYF